MEQSRVIGLDSWIFLEYFVEGLKFKSCKQLVLSKDTKVMSAAALMEIRYRGTKIAGRTKARRFLHDIKIDPSVTIVDVDSKIAERAAGLRLKYYNKDERELSYADCIHIATAINSKCDKFYSGDPDFKGIKEISVEII